MKRDKMEPSFISHFIMFEVNFRKYAFLMYDVPLQPKYLYYSSIFQNRVYLSIYSVIENSVLLYYN
jgi:hypothetical protein